MPRIQHATNKVFTVLLAIVAFVVAIVLASQNYSETHKHHETLWGSESPADPCPKLAEYTLPLRLLRVVSAPDGGSLFVRLEDAQQRPLLLFWDRAMGDGDTPDNDHVTVMLPNSSFDFRLAPPQPVGRTLSSDDLAIVFGEPTNYTSFSVDGRPEVANTLRPLLESAVKEPMPTDTSIDVRPHFELFVKRAVAAKPMNGILYQ